MKKYVDGIVFDSAECENWTLAYYEGSKATYTMYHTKSGRWIMEKAGKQDHVLELLSDSKEAAKVFTKYGKDIPSTLLSELSN